MRGTCLSLDWIERTFCLDVIRIYVRLGGVKGVVGSKIYRPHVEHGAGCYPGVFLDSRLRGNDGGGSGITDVTPIYVAPAIARQFDLEPPLLAASRDIRSRDFS